MGIIWYVVLLPFGGDLPLNGEYWALNLLAMCLASLGVAATFRNRILNANEGMQILLSIFLPCYGAFLFGIFAVIFVTSANLVERFIT